MNTEVVNLDTIERKWYVVDAEGMVLGRLATKIAGLLIGKSKPAYSPNQDHGDNVIVLNAEKVILTGKKEDTKTYFRHSQQPGGEKFRSFKDQREMDATVIIRKAVHGMVPKTKLGKAIERKLHVYVGGDHPHGAQKPETISL